MELIKKLKSLELYLSAHPDNEEHSECRDRLEDVIELQQKVKELTHYRDTTVNLWATDRPDLVEDPKKILFKLEF